MFKKIKFRKKGFNLIQLLVVMLIIAVLIAIALPKYLGYSKKAFETRLMHDARAIQDAVERYYYDNDKWPRLGDALTRDKLPGKFLDIKLKDISELDGDDYEYFFERLEGDYEDAGVEYKQIKLYNIDFEALGNYINLKTDPGYFVLRNPVGDIYICDPKDEVTIQRLASINYDNTGSKPIYDSGNNGIIDLNYMYEFGDGSLENPYQIWNLTDLNHIRNDLLSNYIIMADINAEATKIWNDGEGWEPIGSIASFRGTLNGNKKSIWGIYINRSIDNVGLFGSVTVCSIDNLYLRDVSIEGVDVVGGIVGYFHGESKLINSSVSGSVKGSYQVGGLVGRATMSTNIESCKSRVNVGGVTCVGGIAGSLLSSSTMKNVYGDNILIMGDNQVGGLVGQTWQSARIFNSYVIGEIKGKDAVGGLVGNHTAHSLDNYSLVGESVVIDIVLERIEGVGAFFGRLMGIKDGSKGVGRNNYAADDIVEPFLGAFSNKTLTGADGLDTLKSMFKTQSFYENLGWGFGGNLDNPWKIDDCGGYPYLFWE